MNMDNEIKKEEPAKPIKPVESDTKEPVIKDQPPLVVSQNKFIAFLQRYRKRLLIIVPAVIVILFIIGLFQQGYVNDWVNRYKQASASFIVLDPDNKPVSEAKAQIGDNVANTDKDGKATISGLIAGSVTLKINKAGFSNLEQNFTLNRKANDLGSLHLQRESTVKLDGITLPIKDYATEEPILDASPSIGGADYIIKDNAYYIRNINTGSYTLEIKKSGYNDFSKEVSINSQTTALDPVFLVKKGRVAYEITQDSSKRVFSVNYDGTDSKILVTPVAGTDDYLPSISPNRDKVLFYSTRDSLKLESGQARTMAYVINIDGTGLTRVNQDIDVLFDAYWSPDGKYIIYTSRPLNQGTVRTTIYIYSVANKALRKIDGFTSINGTKVSADDSYIIFSGQKSGDNQSVYISKTDSINPVKIGDGTIYNFEYSIGLFRYSIFDNTSKSTTYYEYNIVNNTLITKPAPINNNIDQVLSPDIKHMSYVSSRDNSSNLYVSNPDSNNESKITDSNGVAELDVSWGLDSDFLVYVDNGSQESAYYLVAINGTVKPKKIIAANEVSQTDINQ